MIVLPVTADREIPPPMIIFKEKTEQTIHDLNIPPGFIVEHNGWMDR